MSIKNLNIYTNCMRWGKNLLVRGYDADGNRIHEKVEFSPTVYIKADPSESTTPFTSTPYKTLNKEPLVAITGMDMKRAKEFIQGNLPGDVFGMDRFEYQWTSKKSPGQSGEHSIGFIDIETECEDGFPDIDTANEEINLITIRVGDNKFTIGTTKHGTMAERDDPNHKIINCDGEDELITAFLEEWKSLDPDIITGWNVNLFDLPYLYNRIKARQGTKVANKMSPWGIVTPRQVMINGRQQTSYIFYGLSILDYYDLYRKFTYVQLSSYKLDYVAFVELGQKKLSYAEHDTIHSFYKKDWAKFVDYNIKDVDIVFDLEESLQFITLALQAAYDANANPHDVFSQVRIWDLLIYQHLKYVKDAQPVSRVDVPDSTGEQYAGAYVKEPVPGIYDWIVTFDVASMYPNAIRYLNISPETVVDDKEEVCPALRYLCEQSPEENINVMIDDADIGENIRKNAELANVCVSPTGDMFDKTATGFLPEMMRCMFDVRKKMKALSDEAGAEADVIHVEMKKRGLV